MKLPRSLSGEDLAKGLGRVGYRITRQTGSHIRMTLDGPPQHHLTVPAHAEIKAGTLSAILSMAGQHLQFGKQELFSKLEL